MGRLPTKPRPKHSGQTGPRPGRMTVLIAPVTRAGFRRPRRTCAFETQRWAAMCQNVVDLLDRVAESTVEPAGGDRRHGDHWRRRHHSALSMRSPLVVSVWD